MTESSEQQDLDFYEKLYNHPVNRALYATSRILIQTLGNALLLLVIKHENRNQYRTMIGYLWAQVTFHKYKIGSSLHYDQLMFLPLLTDERNLHHKKYSFCLDYNISFLWIYLS